MSEHEDDLRLKALFAADAPPPRDVAFETAVLAEAARHRFAADVGLLAGVCVAAGFLLWAIWPRLAPLIDGTAEALASAAGALVLAGVTVWLAERAPLDSAPDAPVRNHD